MTKRRSRIVEYHGRQIELTDLAKEKGLHRNTLASRIDRQGMSVEDAADTPVDAVVITDQGRAKIQAKEPPSRQLKNYLLERIKRGIEAIPDDEFQELLHSALRKDFLATLRELGPWLPKEGEMAARVASMGAGVAPIINIDKAYMPQNVIDYEPM